RGRILAAELSRHGADRRHLAANLRWPHECADVADDFSAEAVSLALSDHALSRHNQRRTELRLRTLHPKDFAGTAAAARLEHVESGLQRRGAGACGDAAALRRDVCSVRLSPGGFLSMLWTGRGDANRFRWARRQAASDPSF